MHDVHIGISLGQLRRFLHVSYESADLDSRQGFGDAVKDLAANVASGADSGSFQSYEGMMRRSDITYRNSLAIFFFGLLSSLFCKAFVNRLAPDGYCERR